MTNPTEHRAPRCEDCKVGMMEIFPSDDGNYDEYDERLYKCPICGAENEVEV